MAGVEADADARRSPEEVDDPREVLEAMSQVGALSRGVFEQDLRLAGPTRCEQLGEAVADQDQAAVFGAGRVGARMHDETVQPQRLGAIQLVAERIE